jgi:hypothetical protein
LETFEAAVNNQGAVHDADAIRRALENEPLEVLALLCCD